MKTYILVIVSFCIFSFTSCMDDKGNYNYKEMNEVNITSLEEDYYTNVGDTLFISPKVDFTKLKTDNIDYEWNLNFKEVLSTESSLTFIASDTANATENIVLCIKNRDTGYKTQAHVRINISQIYSTGWLVLSEKDGVSSLNLFRGEWVEKDDGEYDYKFKEFFDIYKSAEKSDLGSKPLFIHEHWRQDNSQEDGHIMVVQDGGQGCVDLLGSNIRKSLNLDQEFLSVPENFSPKDVLFAEHFSYVLNKDGKVYSRKNVSSNVFHSGYFLEYPVSFNDNGVFKELNVDRFIKGVNYRDKKFILMYEKENKRFLALSEFQAYKKQDKSGEVRTLEYDKYPENYIPLHNIGDNELFYAAGRGMKSRKDRKYLNLCSIFKNTKGEYVEQQVKIMFDAYKSSSITLVPLGNRHFPDGFLNENCIIDVPDGGGKYGSYNIYVAKGNKLYYYDGEINSSEESSAEIELIEYYTFDSDIVAIDDFFYQNNRMCVGLEDGSIFIMDISKEALGGQSDKFIYKVSKPVGKIKQIIWKSGSRYSY